MAFYKYNSHNKKFWKAMRNQNTMTKAEWLLWNTALKQDKTWYRFLRQKLIWNYILDFYCAKLKLCIEVDDQSHDRKWEEDAERTKYLNSLWITVIRYTNEQIYYNLDWVIEDLYWRIEEMENNKKEQD
jgi:very-short-patch-repair endonuclease